MTIVNNPPRSRAALARVVDWPGRLLLLAAFSSLAACGSSEPPPFTPGGGPGIPGGDEVYLRSGFEAGVTLEDPFDVGGEWVHRIMGADQGFDWLDLPNREPRPNNFHYLVSSSLTLADYAKTEIQTVTGRDGNRTRALYMELKKEAPPPPTGDTRIEYAIYPPTTMTQAYARMWLKFQPNLATDILPEGIGRARQVMELRDWTSDFRVEIFVRRSQFYPNMFWWSRGQRGVFQNDPVEWEVLSHDVSGAQVPIDEWFLFEVFWKLGVTDGRIWAAVNGQTIVDYTGRTQVSTAGGLSVWWPFKVYMGSNLEDYNEQPIYQWVDDVEFASEPP